MTPPTARMFFMVAASAMLVATALLHAVGIFRNTLGCEVRKLAGREYVGYCEQERFTDYEHGAVYYDLEPGSLQAMRAARVLFLGNSRLQLGIDQKLLAEELARADIPYFVLGFGYKEQYRFALEVIRKFQLTPSALVINADPYFEGALSVASSPILEKKYGEPLVGYLYRRSVQRAKKALCAWSALQPTRLCSGYRFTIFRHRETGGWRLPAPVDGGVPIEPPLFSDEAKLARYSANARELLAVAAVPPRCAFVLSVPSPMVPVAIAPGIAAQLGAPYVGVDEPGLRSFDRSHLTYESSTRWTRTLLGTLVPRLTECNQRNLHAIGD